MRRTAAAVVVLLAGSLITVVPMAANAGAVAARATITVDPSTDLANLQTVHVSGGGFAPNIALGATECKAGPVSISDCDLNHTTFPDSDASGDYAFDYDVRTALVTDNGLVDCTASSGACVMAVADTTDLAGTAVTAPLTFAETGPPQGGVVHVPAARVPGDEYIEMQGTKFAPVAVIETAICAAGATSADQDCADPQPETTDGTGAFDASVYVPSTLFTQRQSSIDCTVDGSCVFAAWDFRDFNGTLSTAAVRLAPEVPGTLDVSPASGLHGGDNVTLSGTGWPATLYVNFFECDGPDEDTSTCDNYSDALTDTDGAFSTPYTVQTSLSGAVDCDKVPCWIVATWDTSDGTVSTAQPIHFDTTPVSITSHYTAAELAAVTTAASTLGISNEEEQHLGSWGLAFVLAITRTGTITPVANTGPTDLTTQWPPDEYPALVAFASIHGTSLPEFQKTGALFLAYVLAIS